VPLRVWQPARGSGHLGQDGRPSTGGFLVQTADQTGSALGETRVVTAKRPDDATLKDLQFAWTVVKHVRSNAIVLVHEGAAIGIGAGQMSRVEAVELAVHRAGGAGDALVHQRAAEVIDAGFQARCRPGRAHLHPGRLDVSYQRMQRQARDRVHQHRFAEGGAQPALPPLGSCQRPGCRACKPAPRVTAMVPL